MNHRTFVIAGIMLMLLYYSVNAQTGIYATVADYHSNTLTYPTADSGHERIHLHNFFGNGTSITVAGNGTKRRLLKSAVYGYRDSRNGVHRFYHNADYRIAEPGSLYIYTQTENRTQSKGFVVVKRYYFSLTADGDIWPLTLPDVRRAFAGNDKMQDLLFQFFPDGNVTAYDALHGMYLINYVCSKALQR